MSDQGSTAAERPQRRPRAELRRLIVEAALDLVHRDGLGLGIEDLTYARVFAHLQDTKGVRVTRGSVHERIWDSQRHFQLDILQRAVDYDADDLYARAGEVAASVLESADTTTAAGRIEAVKELCRLSAPVNLAARAGDRDEAITLAASASLPIERDDDSLDQVIERLRQTRDASENMFVELLTRLAGSTGTRPSRELFGEREAGTRLFAALINALAEGLVVRQRVGSSEASTFLLPTGPNRGLEEWDLFGLGLYALTQLFVEPDPEAVGARSEASGAESRR